MGNTSSPLKLSAKTWFTLSGYALLVIVIAFLLVQNSCSKKDGAAWRTKYLASQGTIKEDEGRYAALCVELDSEKSMKELAAQKLDSVYQVLSRRHERVIYLQSIIASFKPLRDTIAIPVLLATDSVFDYFATYPPDTSEFFIAHQATFDLKNNTALANWMFNDIRLHVVITENLDKTWTSRLIGPDFLVIDSMEVNTLPPDKINKPPFFRFVAGAGSDYYFTDKIPAIRGTIGFATRKNYIFVLSTNSRLSVGAQLIKIF